MQMFVWYYVFNKGGSIMEKAEEIAKLILSLDNDDVVFHYNLINLNGHNCLEGKVRLNKYLHIMQMTYMAMFDKKLFDDKMFAYDNGAVVKEILNDYPTIRKERNNYKVNEKERVIPFIKKMYIVLKPAPLQDLIEISHLDKEWQINNRKGQKNQEMNVDSQLVNYKKICADFIKIYDKI
jgi:uncharacterized phage-associated protein